MLRMRKLTDYGFVVLGYLAQHRDPPVHTARAIAEGTGIPQPTVAKVLKQLGRSDLVASTRGLCGGYSLAREPEDIPVLTVLEVFEGPVALTECALPQIVECDDAETCSVAEHWPPINRAVRTALAAVTLADISAGATLAEAAK